MEPLVLLLAAIGIRGQQIEVRKEGRKEAVAFARRCGSEYHVAEIVLHVEHCFLPLGVRSIALLYFKVPHFMS